MSTTETKPEIGTERKPSILPPWSVVLHNDDHNEMLYVVRCLVRSVPNLGTTRATQIMLEAHNRGKAIVTTCQLDRRNSLTAMPRRVRRDSTIEKS